MLKKKKITIITIVSFLIILLAFYIVWYFSKEENIQINLNELNQSFIQKGEFNLSNMQDISKEYIMDNIGIKEENVINYIGKVPIVEISSSMYLVLETPSKNDAESVLEKLEKFVTEYELSWNSFLLSEQSIIQDRKIGIIGNYAYIIIAENSDELEKLI